MQLRQGFGEQQGARQDRPNTGCEEHEDAHAVAG